MDGSTCAATTGFAILLELLEEVGRLQVDSIMWFQRLRLENHNLLLSFDFNFNFGHYTEAPFSVAYCPGTHQDQ